VVGRGFVSLLLIVLCVRSFSWSDSLYRDPMPTAGNDLFGITSFHGNVIFTKYVDPFGESDGWGMENAPIDDDMEIPATTLGFALRREPSGFSVSLPYWSLFILLGAVSSLPWFPWRYRLRTLLIATTLVAVLLGLIVWAAK